MFKTEELASIESLLLKHNVPVSSLIYLLKCKAKQPQMSLREILTHLRLVEPPVIAAIESEAVKAVKAAGGMAFSFSKGALIGPWEIHDLRGQGPNGSHYTAIHESNKTSCLLRLIQPGLSSDAQRLSRFDERANAGAEPPHGSILKVDEVAEDFGWLFAVTHNFDGWNLASRLAQGHMQEGEVIPIMKSVCEALAVAHNYQVVHGGITPLSLVMDQQGTIFLTDFGVGAVHLDGPLTGQRPGVRLGNMLYTAPEVLHGKAVDGIEPRADIYALGAVAYDAMLHAACGQEANTNFPWKFAPACSESFKIVLSRCLAPDPQHRYAKVEDLIADLDRIVAGTTPATLVPAAAAPFLVARVASAVPQQVITAALLGQLDSNSEEEIMARSQAGEDFLKAVMAAADAPVVPENFTEELFQPESESNAPVAQPIAPAPTVGEDNQAAPPEAKAEQPSEDKAPKKKLSKRFNKGKVSDKSGSGTSKRKGLTKNSGTRKGAGSASAVAPRKGLSSTRRSRETPTKSGMSVVSVFALLLVVGALVGGAFAARSQFKLPAVEQAHRQRARAEYCAQDSVAEFGQALVAAQSALIAAKQAKDQDEMVAGLRELKLGIDQRALSYYNSQRKAVLALAGKERTDRFAALKKALRGTAAGLVVEADELTVDTSQVRRFNRLQDIAARLYQLGQSQESLKAFEACSKIETNPFTEKALKIVRLAQNMRYVPAGSVTIEGQSQKVPAFYMDETEVTHGAYAKFLAHEQELAKKDKDHNPKRYLPKNWKPSDPDNLPVVGVSFTDAGGYAKWIDKRLPTELEFTLARIGPGYRTYPWGNEECSIFRACSSDAFSSVTPVASFPAGASPHKLHDLLGNAAEICLAADQSVVVLGGSYKTASSGLLEYRQAPGETDRLEDFGFRCVLDAQFK